MIAESLMVERKPRVAEAVLYRDLKQIAPPHLLLFGILALTGVVQVMFLGLTSGAEWFRNLPDLCLSVVPVMSALICAAVLIGQERELGGWNWTTSLPVGSDRVLLLRSLLAAGAAGISVALAMVLVFLLQIHGGLKSVAWDSLLIASAIWLQTWCALAITMLLADQVFWGLVTGGIAAGLLQFLQPPPVLNNPDLSVFSPRGESLNPAWLAVNPLVHAALIVSLVWIHRWRWGQGRDVRIWEALSQRRLGAAGDPASSVIDWPVTAGTRIGMARALTWQSLRMPGTLVRVIACGTVLLWCGVLFDPLFTRTLIAENQIALFAVFLLLGMAGFVGDWRRNAYRFLATQGATPWKVVIARMSGPFAIALAIAMAVHWFAGVLPDSRVTYSRTGIPGLWIGAIGWSVGCLCGICIRSSIIAMLTSAGLCLAIIGGLLAASLLMPTVKGSMQWQPGSIPASLDLRQTLELVAPGWAMAPVVLTFACGIWLVRRWLLLDRPGLKRWLAAAGGTAIAASFFLPLWIRTTSVPVVPWRGAGRQEVPAAFARLTAIHCTRPDRPAIPDNLKLADAWMEWAYAARTNRTGDGGLRSRAGRSGAEDEGLPDEGNTEEFANAATRLIQRAEAAFGTGFSGDGAEQVYILHRLHGDLVTALPFLVETKRYEDVRRALQIVRKIRMDDAGRLSGIGVFDSWQSVALLGTESGIDLIEGLGGPEETIRLLQSVHPEFDAARQAIEDLCTVYRYGLLFCREELKPGDIASADLLFRAGFLSGSDWLAASRRWISGPFHRRCVDLVRDDALTGLAAINDRVALRQGKTPQSGGGYQTHGGLPLSRFALTPEANELMLFCKRIGGAYLVREIVIPDLILRRMEEHATQEAEARKTLGPGPDSHGGE